MTDAPACCPSCGFNLVAQRAVVIGPLAIDPLGVATIAGAALRLSPAEFDILAGLAHADGRLLSRDALAGRAASDALGNAIQVLVHRLRRKLAAAGLPAAIENISGRGYRLAIETFKDPASC